MIHALTRTRREGERTAAPSPSDLNPAALALVSTHGSSILRTARRYSKTPEDAEDAYQRGLEILLTKAPSSRQVDLVPWLKTVVKHEAFAIRRSRERGISTPESDLDAAAAPAPATEDRVEQHERLQTGAEAMSQLKPQEVRCLSLLAEGFSYNQICEQTGFTYTKVNRCVSEGRRAFRQQVTRIESGAECERLAPRLSALADGELEPAEIRTIRRHLRGCPACRATLVEFRSAPARVAALLPPVAVLAGEGPPGLGRAFGAVAAWVQERAAAIGLKLQGATEVASAQKVAAVAASGAAIAGGGAGAVKTLEQEGRTDRRPVPAQSQPSAAELVPYTQPEAARPPRGDAGVAPGHGERGGPEAGSRAPSSSREPALGAEFGGPEGGPTTSRSASGRTPGTTSEFASASGRSGGSARNGEFGPQHSGQRTRSGSGASSSSSTPRSSSGEFGP